MIKNMDKVLSLGLMAENTKVAGKKENNMVKVYMIIKKKLEKVSGKMVKEKNGPKKPQLKNKLKRLKSKQKELDY